jgi:hypothetical protein
VLKVQYGITHEGSSTHSPEAADAGTYQGGVSSLGGCSAGWGGGVWAAGEIDNPSQRAFFFGFLS